tara:strand:- start:184 stop:849 length:666 start_codon:yes stop_codon:yes gene_type:complete
MFKQIFDMFKSDSLYEQALSECHEMLDIDREMFNESVKSLRQSDSAEIPINIYEMDKKINSFERDVRRKIMTHLAISGNEDLSSGLVLTSVVIDIERIGDYAKNIYDLALRYPKKLKVESIEDRVASIEDSSQSFFNNTIDAFKNQNIDLARELMSGYKEEISSISSEVVKDIISGKISDIDASEASAICLYVRYLKRISAHSRNLISSIVNPFERIGYPE